MPRVDSLWVRFVAIPLLAIGCSRANASGGSPRLGKASSPPERGAAVYELNCAGCHGPEGRGNGPAAPYLFPKPRDFGSGIFKLTSTPTGSLPTDEDLFRVITEGMPGSAMPSWELLPENDRWALVAYLKTLVRFWDEEEESWISFYDLGRDMTSVEVPPPPPRTPETIAKGKVVYRRAECWTCHGEEGRGDGLRANELFDDWGHPIRARDFTAGIFKGGNDPPSLYRRVTIGLNGTPMPSQAQMLTPEERWDVVFYVLSMARPGAQEMAKQVRRTIVARRVESDEAWMDPASSRWARVPSTWLALMPLWWRERRVEGLLARAVHDGERLFLHLTWEDTTRNVEAVRSEDFRDAVAVQWARTPNAPFIAMGAGIEEVNLWFWKADREGGPEAFPDVQTVYPNLDVMDFPEMGGWKKGEGGSGARTLSELGPRFATGWAAGNPVSNPESPSPVENLAAHGFSTLEALPRAFSRVEGKGVHDRGVWSLVLWRPFGGEEAGEAPLAPGRRVPVAFAVWDGEAGDRDGQKSITIWHDFEIAW